MSKKINLNQITIKVNNFNILKKIKIFKIIKNHLYKKVKFFIKKFQIKLILFIKINANGRVINNFLSLQIILKIQKVNIIIIFVLMVVGTILKILKDIVVNLKDVTIAII